MQVACLQAMWYFGFWLYLLFVRSWVFVCGWTGLLLAFDLYKNLLLVDLCVRCPAVRLLLCVCWWIGPPAVGKQLCAGGGSQLPTSCYIIAAFSSSEANVMESQYYRKERLVLHCFSACAPSEAKLAVPNQHWAAFQLLIRCISTR